MKRALIAVLAFFFVGSAFGQSRTNIRVTKEFPARLDSTYIRNVNTTEQSPADDVAFVTVRLSDGRLGHQPTVMRRASSELQKQRS